MVMLAVGYPRVRTAVQVDSVEGPNCLDCRGACRFQPPMIEIPARSLTLSLAFIVYAAPPAVKRLKFRRFRVSTLVRIWQTPSPFVACVLTNRTFVQSSRDSSSNQQSI